MQLSKFFKRKIIEKPAYLYVDTSAIQGRGVFTKKAIKRGSVIERSPLVLINEADSQLLRESILYDFYFMVKSKETPVAFGLGFSSVYNHAAPSNARYSIDLSVAQIIIKAHRYIRMGEEITINYHGYPEDSSPVTFTNRDK